ncbi:retention module-containing protein [Nitrincola sp. A-D6]|uniref:retention module-containing protein n=1 Tax=Nitrincola sp. A-D6 TaxID=1545442 RepID=UPI001184DA49|nr:retention module-containing protein [Nitrincola sp. A-D6]
MSPQVATIVSLTGEVSARAEDGTIRVLTQGDALFAGEVLITADGSQVVLDYGNGELVSLNGPQSLQLTENQITASALNRLKAKLQIRVWMRSLRPWRVMVICWMSWKHQLPVPKAHPKAAVARLSA